MKQWMKIDPEEWIWSKDTLRDIIDRLLDENRDVQERAELEKSDFNDGMSLAYEQMISMLDNQLSIRGSSLEELMKAEKGSM